MHRKAKWIISDLFEVRFTSRAFSGYGIESRTGEDFVGILGYNRLVRRMDCRLCKLTPFALLEFPML